MAQQSLLPEDPYYLLDSNIIIDLTLRGYPVSKYPELYKALDRLINEGKVKSVREVLRELKEGETKKPDPALEWALKHESMFLPLDDFDDEQMAIVAPYFEHDISKSIRPYADPHLVAHALAHKSIVVTDESSTPNLNGPKVPEICAKLDVECVDIWKFLKDTGLIKYIKK